MVHGWIVKASHDNHGGYGEVDRCALTSGGGSAAFPVVQVDLCHEAP